MKTRFVSLLLAGIAATLNAAAPVPEKLDPDQLAFFEKKIRPVLVEQCYKCHSATSEKVKGGLLLDTKEALLKGGSTGPAIVPGKPDKSLLIKLLKSDKDDERMPPKGDALSDHVIADFEQWVRSGAPDPRVTPVGAKSGLTVDMEKAKKHWAFQPVSAPPMPQVKDSKHWARTPLDKFVLAKLEAKNIEPSPLADKRTLIRRATFDLIGLPPSPQEVADFLADNSPTAFEKVVDRLLASPHYGERWARHWLDVARYADTSGDRTGGKRADPKYPYAWTYRDYVINAFNADKPYDRFIVEQLVADRLELGESKMPLAALGFLTVGKRFMGNINEVIDDRIDVVTQGLMGMTAACARCHDHKFDPIPQRDYYGLHGVFASSQEPEDEPMLYPPADKAAYADFLKKSEEIEANIAGIRETEERRVLAMFRAGADKYLLAAREFAQTANKKSASAFSRQKGLDPDIFDQWVEALNKWQGAHHPVLSPWFAIASLKDEDFAGKAKELAEKFATGSCDGKAINPLVAKLFSAAPKSLDEVAEAYAKLFKDVDKAWQAAEKDGAKSFEAPREEVRLVLYGSDSPIRLDRRGFQRVIGNRIQNLEGAEHTKLSDLKLTHPGSPARAMALTDKARPADSFIMIRGEPANRGPVVPRQFLEILSTGKPEPFKNGSGRLDLAHSVASRDNPLTARVFANRMWHWHFGDAIVRTLGDFGLRSEPPSNQELLDYLATQFMGNGWSVKKLHKLILLSATWQQSSRDNPKNSAVDPGNSLFWRQNLQRLDFESLRDALLVLGGKNEFEKIGGPSVDLAGSGRRTLYGYLDRAKIPDAYRIFDFANPDMTAPQRLLTTVPLQALFMMNNPFVIEQARNITSRPEMISGGRDEEKVSFLYQLINQRSPSAGETKLALAYLADQRDKPATGGADVGAWRYGYGEYDAKAKKLKNFEPMPLFLRESWVLADKEQLRKVMTEPEPAKGKKDPAAKKAKDARMTVMGAAFAVSLNAVGGNPGDAKHAVVRRWVSPVDGEISIEGALIHKAKNVEGVQGFVYAPKNGGQLGAWTASGSEVETRVEHVKVKKGDVFDFVAMNRGASDGSHEDDEAFTWAPIIHLQNPAKGQHAEWNAQQEFSGPPRPAGRGAAVAEFTPWERLTQAMLLANELIYIN
ncbi:MAG: PSD1 domain-containing protein [Verrucomicrobia bacterium]|nr:PSD1 domain-containing protein [Verrucomicrobiota bacterium]